MTHQTQLQNLVGRFVMLTIPGVPGEETDDYGGTLESLGDGLYRVVDPGRGPMTFHQDKVEIVYNNGTIWLEDPTPYDEIPPEEPDEISGW